MRLKNERAIALSLFNTGSLYGIIGQVPKSLEILNQSLALYKKFSDRLSEGDLFNQISNINTVGFQFTEGLKIDPITKAPSEFKPNLAFIFSPISRIGKSQPRKSNFIQSGLNI